MNRLTAAAAAAAIGAATAVVATVIGTTAGVAATGTSEAFGVSAEGTVPIDPTPHVVFPGEHNEDDLVNIPLGDNGEIRAATLSTGDNVASVELAGIDLDTEQGSITAEAVTVKCHGTTGAVQLVHLTVNGENVVIPPADENPVNEVIDLSPAAKITYNKQAANADGTFTVVGLEIELLDQAETVTIGSATCAPASTGDDGGAGTTGPAATSPAPITTGLPVTG